ncbi:MAG: hypothetical protein PHW33_03310, partial [Candidatus Portnoybacteria bacterium]|nr:hypothetical protein [Candidatus Portnoybacteria bacterium]
MPKQNIRTLPKIYLIAGIFFSAFFVFMAKPERALAAPCAISGDNVTIASSCTLLSGNTYTYTGTLTIPIDVVVTVTFEPELPSQTVINSDNIVMNGTINLNGQGYLAGGGTGAGVDGGGGYGGVGGGTSGGITYGSATEPTDLGSGGSGYAGGGSIKLVATDITLGGSITANGASTLEVVLGAGSGGSIWIAASGTLSGSGSLTANGGDSPAGGGGGGRIKVTAGASTFTGTGTATKGSGGTPAAADGTVQLPTNPTISGLIKSPSAVAGDESMDITIRGTNFVPTSVARMDGVDKNTEYFSATAMIMHLTAADVSAAGTFNVTVYNSSTGEGSNSKTLTLVNGEPTLDGVTPSSKYVLDTDLTLALTGSKFVTASQVFLDSVVRALSYVGPTQLTVTLLSSDLAIAGSHLIEVVNPTPGGGTSTAATFVVHIRPAPPGGGASSVSYNYTTNNNPSAPLAGFGKALDSSSIKWNFSSTPSNNIQGFKLVDSNTGAEYATIADPNAKYIIETGLSASTTYCDRAVKSYSASASSVVEPSSIFPCEVTLPMAMATSSEFVSNPIKIINTGIEELELGWTATSSDIGKNQPYGFYIPALSKWVAPDASSTAGILVYKLAALPFYQTIGQWGQNFRLIGLDSDTPYKFLVSKTNSGVWEFSVTTTKGALNFEAEMEMILQSEEPMPTSSTTLSVLSGAAQRSWPSLAPVVFLGTAALVYHHHIKRRKKPTSHKKKSGTKKPRTRSTKKTGRRTKLASLLLILGIGAASILGFSALPAKAEGVQTLTYSIKFKNTGTKTAKNVLVSDPIPTGAIYYPGSLRVDGVSQTDTHDADNAWYSTGPDQANFFWASVAPGVSHEMKFSVYLQSGVKYEQVSNSATLQPENADPGSLPISIHEQSVCGNGKIEVKRDSNGNPILSSGKVVWEVCDDGANNAKGYGWCNADCSAVDLPPSNLCGNAKIDEWTNLKTGESYKETCDQGTLNGQPGKCNLTCNGTVPLPPPKPKPPEPKKEEEKQPEQAEEVQQPVASGGTVATTTLQIPTTTEPVVAPVSTSTTTTVEAPTLETLPPTSSGTTRVDAISMVITQAAAKASKALASPEVEQTAIPVVGIVTAANVVTAGGWIPLLNYLYYIFTQPIMLIGRRRKQKYGVVYNSLSKLPLDLAAVRVKDNSGRIVQTKVTDRQGRYNFLIPKGQYTLDISKPGYVFPTSLLSGKTQDVDYIDLLTNNKLSLGTDAIVSNNIPLDPKEDMRTPGEIKRKAALRHLQGGIS